MTPIRLAAIIFFTALTTAVAAQNSDTTATNATDSAVPAAKTHLVIGATYNSGLNYYGRVDSLHSKAMYPSVGLFLKDGIYANASFVFIHNNLESLYAATLLEAGYNFKDHNGRWAGNLSVSQFFYSQGIEMVQSVVKEAASASITHLNKVINITLGANLKWSDQIDLGGQAGLDHIIRLPHIFGSDDVLVLDPSANVYAGTQNFTQTYYEKRNLLIFPIDQQEITTNSRRFNILAYEFSFPVVYGYKKMNILLTPSYVLPQNLLAAPGQPSLSEYGSDMFYFTATVKISL